MPSPKSSIARNLTLALLGALIFIWLAAVSVGPVAPSFDQTAHNDVPLIAGTWLTAAMKFVTFLGGGWFLWTFGLLIVCTLVRLGRRHEAALFAMTVMGANLLNESMKLLFHRPRPNPFFGYAKPDSYSFPSGHSFVSFCFYLALAEILIDTKSPRHHRIVLRTAALLLVLSIGLSRIYLGVHYPSDVAGGYAAAIAWTFAIRTGVALYSSRQR